MTWSLYRLWNVYHVSALLMLVLWSPLNAQQPLELLPPVPDRSAPLTDQEAEALDLPVPLRTRTTQRPSSSGSSSRAKRSLDLGQESPSERLSRIRMKLDRLKQIAAREERRRAAPNAKQNKQYQTLPVQRPRALDVEPPAEAAKPQMNLPANGAMESSVTPLPPMRESSGGPETPVETETTVDIENAHPISITDTVDQLAMANNLFAQNDIANATAQYEHLLKSPQTAEDIVWIQYQLAGCYRRSGNTLLAKKHYRMVASNKKNDYWSQRAVWWLEYLRRSSTRMEKQQQLEAELKSLQQELDATRSK